MKTILYVITKSAPWGGAQRYVFDLVTHLPKDRFEAAVMLGGNGPLAQRLQAAGGLIYQSTSLERNISISKDIKAFFELLRVIRQYRPDVVHLNSSKAGAV